MSTAEILDELPRLSREERSEILDRLLGLEEETGPSDRERAVLNEAQAAYEADGLAGTAWREVEARLRKRE
jgi:hypothetical protein